MTPSQITQGTATVPYDPLREDLTPTEHIKDRKSWDVHQTITVMPAYSHHSIEELRLMDYQQGRSKGNTGPGAPGAPSTGFGFGANNNTGGAFGQAQQPATGFGASTSTTGGLFGQPQQQQQQSGGLFGAKPAATGFGASTTGGGLFGQQQNQPQTGGLFGQQTQQQQPSTSGFSFGAQPQQPAASTGFTFGANNNQQQQQNKPAFGFGASTTQPAQAGTTGFGFGANNQQQQQPGQTATGFGAGATGTTGGFSFGQKPATGGLFGAATSQPGQTAGATSTFGGFGASNTAQQNKPAFGFGAGGGFGAASGATTGTTSAPAATGGLFGAASSAQPSGGLFGSSTNTGTTGGFSFGANNTQQANQQPGQAGATGGFGGGLFGAKPAGQTGTQPATGGLFGGAGAQTGQTSTGFGAGASTGSGGLFGNTANKPATGGFSFGAGGGSSLFGNNNQQNNQQQGAGGLGAGFGQTQGNTTGGLFGQSNQTAQTGATGGGLFGSSNTAGSSLFGNTGASNTGGGLFGGSTQNQSGGGLFGGLGGGQNQQSTGGLFGQSQQNQLQNNSLQNQQQLPSVQASLDSNPYGTDSLFASNPLNAGAGSTANGASLPFNVAPKNKPPLTTPFRSSPRGASKINRLRGSTPGASGLGSSSFVREGTPGSLREGTPGANTRFGTPGRAGSPALFKALSDEYSQPLSSQAFVSRPSAKRLVLDDAGENSFTASRIGRSGSVPHFDTGSSPAVGSLGASAFRSGTVQPSSASRVTFSPALEQRAESVRPGGGDLSFASSLPSRRGNFFGAASPTVVEDTPLKTVSAAAAKAGVPRQGRDLESSFAASTPSVKSAAAVSNGSSAATAKVGEYYTEPSLAALRTANYNELAAVHNFIVGRKGVGQIEFLEPVDLTSIGDLNDIVGGIVQIRLKEVVVYPEEDDFDPRNPKDGAKRNFVPGLKAKQGTGLNVPARVSLDACWPTDRATREPIKDADHPRVKQMVNKLKNKSETEFVDFEPESGTWTFKVKHFSRYGLDDSDEDDDAAAAAPKRAAQPTAAADNKRPASKRLAPMSADDGESDDDAVAIGAAYSDGSEEDDDDAPPPLRGLDDGDMDTDDDASHAAAAAVAAAKHRQRRQWTPASSVSGRERACSATPSRAMSTMANAAEARRVQVMQASFFGHDDSKLASAAVVAARPMGASLSHKKTLNLRPTAAVAEPIKAAEPMPDKAPEPQEPSYEAAAKSHPAPVQEVQQPAKRLRKTDVARSAVVAADGETLDAGLSLGRSFRVGWGPDGTLVHNGRIVGANMEPVSSAAKTEAEAAASASTSTLILEKIKLFKDVETSKEEAERAQKLLGVQLEQTKVELDDEGVPVAYTDFGTRFRHFASSFEHKDRSFEASLWRLGVALFDEIELRVPAGADAATVERIRAMRRKAALSDWLRHTVAGTVETEARSHIAASRRAALLFSYLSGHQVERAVNAAIEAGDLRLATLIAQAGGDEEVRADISEQLLTWRKEGVDAHMTRDHRRIYELLSGNVLLSPGTDARTTKDPIDQVGDLAICEGLDWKRALGLFLWYESTYEAPLERAFERYEAQVAPTAPQSTCIAPPLPWYRESSSVGATKLRQLLQKAGGYDRDALFELIKLYVDPTYGLEPALNACAFGASNVDARLPWHLYNLLSRVMQRRDFGDRVELGLGAGGETRDEAMHEDGDGAPNGAATAAVQGNSARADMLASSYATQLELLGLWQWAAFVLLHLELSSSRSTAVKALLARNVAQLDAQRDFLCGRLHVPEAWLYEAQSYAARARDDRYGEYQLLLRAHNWTAAHNVVALHLAPEAIIRGDHELVSVLMSPFYLEVGGDPADEIAGWADGAAVYVDYVAASREVPVLASLLAARESRDVALERAERFAARLPSLAAGVNALLSTPGAGASAGERTHMVARTEMIAGITNLARILINMPTATEAVELGEGARATLERISATLLESAAVSGGGSGVRGAADGKDTASGWDPAALEVDAVQAAADDYLASLVAVA